MVRLRQHPVFNVNISGMLLSLHINCLKQTHQFVEFSLAFVFYLCLSYSQLASESGVFPSLCERCTIACVQ